MALSPALLMAAALGLQTPDPPASCVAIEPAAFRRQLEFSNAVAVGSFAMRTLQGERRCDLTPHGQGRCTLRDPRLIHVTLEQRHYWFKLPAGHSAEVEVADDVLRCQVVRETTGTD